MELIPRWIRVIIASCLWVILGILLFIPISWADYKWNFRKSWNEYFDGFRILRIKTNKDI